MGMSVAANHAKGKFAADAIMAAAARCTEDVKKNGADAVINGTIGSIIDENGDLVVLQIVKDTLKQLTPNQIVAYAPIPGFPEYLAAAIDQCFCDSRPEGYIRAIATPGGSGAIHTAVHNYSDPGDEVLTTDWCWGAYRNIIRDDNRVLREFELLTDDGKFNMQSFSENLRDLINKQHNTVIILNSPANNPTGFGLNLDEWDAVLSFIKSAVEGKDKNVILVSDVAYLDYSGEKQECRRFFKKFGNLPANILPIVAYTCSKGFTLYGQRMGAMIGITSSEDVADEFTAINKYTARATWSNPTSSAMWTMIEITKDPEKVARLDAERAQYFQMIKERADIFMKEAADCGLKILPYLSGFFITIPMIGSDKVCAALEKEHIYLVPLKKGIRLAVCSVSKKKITGLAAKVKAAVDAAGIIQ